MCATKSIIDPTAWILKNAGRGAKPYAMFTKISRGLCLVPLEPHGSKYRLAYMYNYVHTITFKKKPTFICLAKELMRHAKPSQLTLGSDGGLWFLEEGSRSDIGPSYFFSRANKLLSGHDLLMTRSVPSLTDTTTTSARFGLPAGSPAGMR